MTVAPGLGSVLNCRVDKKGDKNLVMSHVKKSLNISTFYTILYRVIQYAECGCTGGCVVPDTCAGG